MDGTAEMFAGFAQRIAREAGTQQEMMREGDYIEDGLIHCGKCKGKRQTRVKIPGSGGATITVPCICKCEAKAEEDRKKQEEARQELQRMERLRSASLIENRLKNANLTTFQQTKDNAQLYKIVKNYVQNFDEMYKNNQGLLLYGPVGTGKSYAAACIANELLNQKTPVIMTSFVKILQMIQDKQVEESELIARLNNAKLLIIDDLGTERNTDYGLEKVYNVIDSRYLAGKPLILTTNLMLVDMKENIDTNHERRCCDIYNIEQPGTPVLFKYTILCGTVANPKPVGRNDRCV